MITRRSRKGAAIPRSSESPTWEVEDVEEITEEVHKVMKSMGLTTEEVKKVVPTKRNKNDR